MRYWEGKLLGLGSVTAGRGKALAGGGVVVVICEDLRLMPDTLSPYHRKNLIERTGMNQLT